MIEIPPREWFDKLLDHERAAVVLEAPSRLEARRWLSVSARKAGLFEDRYLIEGDKPPGRELSPDVGRGVLRVDQKLTFHLDGQRLAADGRLSVEQSFELEPGAISPNAPRPVRPLTTQTARVMWLRGKNAVATAQQLALKLDPRLGRAAVIPVYKLKDSQQRIAIDPWMIDIQLKSREPLPRELSEYLEIEKNEKRMTDRWVAARFKRPLQDAYGFAQRFYKLVKDTAELGYRDLLLTVPVAGEPNDQYYQTYPGGLGQKATLASIGAKQMWDEAETRPRSSVRVFLFDTGVTNDSIDIATDVSLSADATGGIGLFPLPPDSGPAAGSTHGPQMASVMGAIWGLGGEPSMAGIFGEFPEIAVVSIKCNNLSDVVLGLQHVAWCMRSSPTPPAQGVIVFGLDILQICKTNFDFVGTRGNVCIFELLLKIAQAPRPGGYDIPVIMPAGNFTPPDPADIPVALNLETTTLIVGACGAAPDALDTRWPGSRWNESGSGVAPSVVAPGANIITCLRTGPTGYGYGNGTSFAAAHVAAVTALVRSVKPGKTAQQVADLIRDTARGLGGTARGTSDPQTGRGCVDGYEALRAP